MSIQAALFVDHILLRPPVETFTGTNVLSRAIETGTVREVHILLDRGCDPNQPSGTWGMRPLMIAQYVNIQRRQRQVVDLLLKYGGLPSLVDNQKRNCLMYACAVQSCECVSLMLQATEYNFYDADSDGNTLLHVCAMVGNIDILKVVLKHSSKYRCDINSKNKYGLTALMVAILRLRRECAMLLHEQGATPRFSTSNFQLILSTMENMSDINVDKITEMNDLLRRILLDSEGVRTQGSSSEQSDYLELFCPKLTSDRNDSDSQRDEETLKCNVYNNPKSFSMSSDYNQAVWSAKLKRVHHNFGRSLSLQSEPEAPSYLASVEDLLTRSSYHIRKTSSYCAPHVSKPKINEDWVDTIKLYCQSESVSVEPSSTVKTSPPQLSRAVSIPAGSRSHTTSSATAQGRPKTRSLPRSTTSPHLFSQTSLSRKSMTYSAD